MAIKRKIAKGFVVIGTILLVSSALSIYEFIRMRDTVSSLINDNISAINTSRQLLEVTDEYNFNLFNKSTVRPVIVEGKEAGSFYA